MINLSWYFLFFHSSQESKVVLAFFCHFSSTICIMCTHICVYTHIYENVHVLPRVKSGLGLFLSHFSSIICIMCTHICTCILYTYIYIWPGCRYCQGIIWPSTHRFFFKESEKAEVIYCDENVVKSIMFILAKKFWF